MHADGENQGRLTYSAERDIDAVLSPDGQWTHLVSERAGQSTLYRIRLDGTELQRVARCANYLGHTSRPPSLPVAPPDGP